MKLSEYSYRNLQFLGSAEGGVHTCVAMPQFRLLFDTGIGSSRLTEYPTILLTHGHLDHSSGLAYLISQRSLRKLPAPDIYVPPEIEAPLRQIMHLWGEIEDYHSRYNLIPVDYTTHYPLKGNTFFRAIRSRHRIPSNGYAIVEKATKLRPEFLDLPGKEIARRKARGEDLFVETYQPVVTFSGDTQIEFVTENEIVRQSRVLFLECTYVCEKRPIARAREWGHTHLDEIVAHADAFADVEHLFLMHFSTRYGRRELEETLTAKLPDWLRAKTTPFLTITPRE